MVYGVEGSGVLGEAHIPGVFETAGESPEYGWAGERAIKSLL